MTIRHSRGSGSPIRSGARAGVLLLALALGFASSGALAAVALITVPDGLADSEGDSSSAAPFGDDTSCIDGMRYQQVIDGDQLSPGNIGSLAFRLDSGESSVGPLTYEGVTISLSTTSRSSGTLSTKFADNVGLDNRVVFSGDLTVSADTNAVAPNPFDFDVIPTSTFPFPGSGVSGGNLLVDIVVEDCPPASFLLDAVSESTDTRGLFAGDRNDDTGTMQDGLVSQLTVSTPPPTLPYYNCPLGGGGGDGLARGIILDDFPADTLGRVELNYNVTVPGYYRIDLTARQGAYNGAVIGQGSVVFTVSDTSETVAATHEFRGAPVRPGSSVMFTHEVVVSPPGGSVFYDVGPCGVSAPDCDACPDVFQTSGTEPPDDSVRRNSVAIEVTPSLPDSRPRGLGGNWSVQDRDAEGFMIDVTDRDQLVVIWFTYDEAGTQMWLLGTIQEFDSNSGAMGLIRIVGPTFEEIRSASFDNSSFVFENWGQMHIRFDDCNSGQVNFESFDDFGSGSFEIERSYGVEQGQCP